MRALVFRGVRDIAIETVADPQLRDHGDVIVRVLRTAICGSDLHPYHGREVGLDSGTVMGHEFIGEVESMGAGVRAWRSGDVVVGPFSTACGACWACRDGLSARCTRGQLFGWVQNGVGLQGAQAERVRVPLADTTLVRAPADVPLEVALLLGDVLVTGAYAVRRAGVRTGSTCAVVGCGPVGLSAVLAARDAGAARVYAFDTIAARRHAAAVYGAIAVDPSAAAALLDATEGRGADAVVEAVGAASSMRLAFALLRAGGTLAIAGVHTEPAFAFTPAQLYDKNAVVCSGRCPARSLMPEMASWLAVHAAQVAALVTHRFPLEHAVEAYALFDGKRDGCIKVVLDASGDGR